MKQRLKMKPRGRSTGAQVPKLLFDGVNNKNKNKKQSRDVQIYVLNHQQIGMDRKSMFPLPSNLITR
jgi:hypothetical protein